MCQIIDEMAVCLSTCRVKGAKRKTCKSAGEHEGLFGEGSLLSVEYECREIDGNLYDYPISYKQCSNQCNQERTDCEE